MLREQIYFFFKRITDIIFSVIGIIILIPVYIVTKISYIIQKDYHPVFYKQRRVGKNGKIIYILKLRSMVHNADEILHTLLKDPVYMEEWKKYQKLKDDPRITRVGKILRKSSLDELPQFINVLKNEMSLVGPRPLVEGELDDHNGDHAIYESVKPGITSWWASHGRSNTTYKERLELEYYYIKNKSLILDLRCIVATIKGVILRDGAK